MGTFYKHKQEHLCIIYNIQIQAMIKCKQTFGLVNGSTKSTLKTKVGYN